MIRRYTTARWPPTLALYCLEAMIQSLRAQCWNRNFEGPLVNVFSWGMKRDMSGRYSDGGVEQVFHFSVCRPSGPPHAITVCFTPFGRFDTSRLGREAISIKWPSTTGDSGTLCLEEDGRAQEFRVVLEGPATCPVIHFRCRANHPAQVVEAGAGLPRRRIIGFLDGIDVADRCLHGTSGDSPYKEPRENE